jgi:hypothetical protein
MKDALCAGLTEVKTSSQLKACASQNCTNLRLPAAVTEVQEHLY